MITKSQAQTYIVLHFPCLVNSIFQWRSYRGGGVWAMAGVQGKVAFGLSHFCVLSFSKKKCGPANSHEDPNLTMHWHRQMGNVAG